MSSARIIVVGAGGRLGRLVVDEVNARASLLGVVDRNGPPLAAVLAGVSDKSNVVVIDVATAGSTALHARVCFQEARVAYLCATTGLSDDDRRELNIAAGFVPVLHAANLSVGAHLVARLAAEAARALPGAEVEIVEVHHSKKRDAPSGTALMLADAVANARNTPDARRVLAREGEALRREGDIGVVAVRGGNVVGEHTVTLFVGSERIELAHKVQDRSVFAAGAVTAAQFLVGKAPGLYSMSDVVA